MSTDHMATVSTLGSRPDDEQDREPRAYETARDNAVMALGKTQERLRELRQQREEINAEIKTLVDDEELLTRMTRVKKGTKGA